jgi:hypothetical protein
MTCNTSVMGTAGVGCGKSLDVDSGCVFHGIKRLWYDDDRPLLFVFAPVGYDP